MLFNKNWEEWDKNIPVKIPKYSNEKLSPYKFGRDADRSLKSENFFASDLIQQINNTSNQEIGTHTYSHYYCLEDGQNRAQFEKDLDQAIELAFNVGIELKSLVFPRNQLKVNILKFVKVKEL